VTWRPPRTRQEATDRAVQSMAPGSWQGKVAQAMPVEVRFTGQVESLDEETLDAISGTQRAEADDFHQVTADDLAAGSATVLLTYQPINESLKLWWEGEFQPPTEYVIDYAESEVTVPVPAYVQEGDLLWVHYWYLEQDPREPEIDDRTGVCPWGMPTRVQPYQQGYEPWGDAIWRMKIWFSAPISSGYWHGAVYDEDGTEIYMRSTIGPHPDNDGTWTMGAFDVPPGKSIAAFTMWYSAAGSGQESPPGDWHTTPPGGWAGTTQPTYCVFTFGQKIASLDGSMKDEPWGPLG
jgi:hypothetical protein